MNFFKTALFRTFYKWEDGGIGIVQTLSKVSMKSCFWCLKQGEEGEDLWFYSYTHNSYIFISITGEGGLGTILQCFINDTGYSLSMSFLALSLLVIGKIYYISSDGKCSRDRTYTIFSGSSAPEKYYMLLLVWLANNTKNIWRNLESD